MAANDRLAAQSKWGGLIRGIQTVRVELPQSGFVRQFGDRSSREGLLCKIHYLTSLFGGGLRRHWGFDLQAVV